MFLRQRILKMKNKFTIPLGVFFLIFSMHVIYSILSSIQISKQWVEIEHINYFLLYFNQQDFMLGLSYALAGAFTIYTFLKFQKNRKKSGVAGIMGGVTLTGILYGGGCFLIGCCGSPMLAVYMGLFGSSFLGLAKPLVLILTILSIVIGLFWIEKRTNADVRAGTERCPELEKNAAEAKSVAPVRSVGAEWTFAECVEHFKCRAGAFRMRYLAAPGLYAIGEPDRGSDVFISANYKLSFDILRSGLKGVSAWILVLDTKGINVWCAAGKGTFGTDELIKRIFEARLYEVVEHKRVIVPQLGAPGVSAHVVQRETGFRVYYGPVEASDIRAYVNAGYKATPEMREKKFPLADRLVLIPMELIPAMKGYAVYAMIIFIISGLKPSGIAFRDAALNGSLPFLFLGFAAIFAGAVLTPLALPFLPSRSFAVKGWIAGMALTVAALMASKAHGHADTLFIALSCLFFPLLSSYVALQFTGSSTYTGMTGVRKEMRLAMPVYIAGAVISMVLLTAFKLTEMGIL
jgi:hypothetical protein